ncbi:MAG TPA: FGGY family carbohydrate kinase [Actinomycetota bacterium]|nr:FGGY family carbohydrate kinase [Actinomycetota bacterium]
MTAESIGAREPASSRGDGLLIALDVGTTGARAVAVDLDGRIVREERRPYKTTTPHTGWAEQDPRDWTDGAVEALGRLVSRLERPAAVLGIGLTGQCPSVAPYDATGRPVGPGLIYRDNRAVEEAATIRDRIGLDALHRRTGHPSEAFHVGPKVLWLRRHEPEIFGSAAVMLQPRDAVLHRIGNRVATDDSHANATLFFDLKARAWAEDLFDAFELDPTLFPEALPSWEVAAELPRPTASEVGLPPGIPIVIGAGDSQCVAFGAGVIDPGPISEMAGSSSCLNSAVVEPATDVRITHYNHVVPGRYTTELGLNATGASIDWGVSSLGYSGYREFSSDAAAYREEVIAKGAADPLAIAPLYFPYLADGERDDPTARAALLGLSSRHPRAAIAYSIAEGVALAVRERVQTLNRAGSPLDELRVAGGAAHLDVLGQMKADALGCRVLHLDADTAAVGTAFLAGDAAGVEEEVKTAILGIVARATRFEPSTAAVEIAAVRGERFDEVRSSRALHVEPR